MTCPAHNSLKFLSTTLFAAKFYLFVGRDEENFFYVSALHTSEFVDRHRFSLRNDLFSRSAFRAIGVDPG
jgi:hypothetical protein